LEIMCAVIPYPGFKSLSLRHSKSSAYALLFYYIKPIKHQLIEKGYRINIDSLFSLYH